MDADVHTLAVPVREVVTVALWLVVVDGQGDGERVVRGVVDVEPVIDSEAE